MGIPIGTLHVRRSAFIRATAERVWEEFENFDRLVHWFGKGHRLEHYDAAVGGRIRLSVDLDGERRYFGGKILAFDPGAELSFEDNWEVDPWPVHCFITIRLTAVDESCHVELFHHGFERFGEAAYAELEAYEAGWPTRHLEALRRIAES